MNSKGQVFFLTFMIGVTLFILALALSPGLRTQIDTTRNSVNLDCGNSSISIFDKATCRVTDLTLFYFIGGLLMLVGVVLTARAIVR